MFGLVPAGRAVQQFCQVGETELMCEISDASSVNHIVIFMTGQEQFPDGLGGSVYIRWPLPNGQETSWHYLGYVCNMKPSAIFKVAQLHESEARHSGVFGGNLGFAGTHGTAQVGLMVEQLSTIEGKAEAEGTTTNRQSTLAEFADKMVKNLVNHAESYAVRLPRPDGAGSADYIPTSALHEWFTSFSRRFQQNPFFWRSLHDN